MIIGLDVSTSTIGYSIFDEFENLILLDYVDLTKSTTLYEKASVFLEVFISAIKKCEITIESFKGLIIEEPLLTFSKFSNAKTLAKLQAFNGIISYAMFTFGLEPTHINAARARKLVCGKLSKGSVKEKVFEFVRKKEPQIDWPLTRTGNFKKQCMDMSDAYIVGRAYFKQQKTS